MNRIRKLRENKGLSQRDFINKFNSFLEENLNKYDGQPGIKKVTFATGSRWENGLNKPTSAMWQALADYFGVSVDWLKGYGYSREELAKLLSDGYNEGFTYQHSRENENNILASIAKSIGSETMQNMVEFQKEYGNLKKVIDLYAELMNLEVPKDEKERVKFFTDKMGFLFEMPEGQRLLHATHSYTDAEVKESLLDALLNFTNMLYHSSKLDKTNDKHQ